MHFYKYQGTGNDFIIMDDRSNIFKGDVKNLCDRRFGIGADGLMLLKNHRDYDFEMVYYNSDGNISSMCGNGGRCIVAFAKYLKIIDNDTRFLAIDGEHSAQIDNKGLVSLGMQAVTEIKKDGDAFVLNTGSPHYVLHKQFIEEIDLIEEAKAIRYNDIYSKEGINVNFIELKNHVIHIRTYERGVENETLSCGTGVTAAAISSHIHLKEENGDFLKPIRSQGGDLEVSFHYHKEEGYSNIILTGPAELVFEGEV